MFIQLQIWCSFRLLNCFIFEERGIGLWFPNARSEGADMLTENTSHRTESQRVKNEINFSKWSVPLEINIFPTTTSISVIVFSLLFFWHKTLKNTNGRTRVWIKITTKFKWVSVTADLMFFSSLTMFKWNLEWKWNTRTRSISFYLCFSLLMPIQVTQLDLYLYRRSHEWMSATN